MGALTLKSFPFELRGWDIEKFESIDPTDGFGRNVRVYISKQKIVQIEPEYDLNVNNNWLSDKGRQFFDGISSISEKNSIKLGNLGSWKKILKTLIQTLYLLDHCVNKQKQKNSFTFLFENVSIELLSLLAIISKNYNSINIRRVENIKLNNDLESHFQINQGLHEKKLNNSNLCLLIGSNPRYESYSLNLELRQRFLKGNFKCFSLGSLINLTFPTNFIGTDNAILKTVIEGNNFFCQDFKTAKNPILIVSNEAFKRNDGQNLFRTLKLLSYSNLFKKVFTDLNILNPSIHETGILNLTSFQPITLRSLTQTNSLFLINVNFENIENFKKLTKTKLLNFYAGISTKPNKFGSLLIDHNYFLQNNYDFCKVNLLKLDKYSYIPSKMFYENKETLINTKGLIKHTSKLISKQNSKDSWKLLRNFLINTKKNLNFLNQNQNNMLLIDLKKKNTLKNYTTFCYHASKKLDNTGFDLMTKNSSFYINTPTFVFKLFKVKLINTKLKYWLDDFFVGGKDDYSQKSLTLTNCSKILRTQSTTFF